MSCSPSNSSSTPTTQWCASILRDAPMNVCRKPWSRSKTARLKWKQQWGKTLWAGITSGPEWGAGTLQC